MAMAIHARADGHLVDANEACARLLGFSRRELLDHPTEILGLMEPVLLANLTDAITTSGHLPDSALTIRARDGSVHDVLVSVQMVEWEGQSHTITLLQDLTDYNRANAALRESEIRFRLFFEALALPVVVFDAATLAILDLNDMTVAQYGYARDELLSRPVTLLWPPEERPTQTVALGAGNGPSGLHQHQRRDGALIAIEAISRPIVIGEQQARLATFADVTEQRAIEAARRHSEEQLRLIADTTTDVIWEFNPQEQVAVYSSGMKTLFGHDAGPHPSPAWLLSLIHPDDRDRVSQELRAAIPHSQGLWNSQYRFLRADGSYAHVLDRGYALQNEPEGLRVVGAMVDITRQIELQEATARAQQEERHRLARDLHNAVTQSVYSLTLMTEAARRRAMQGDERAAFGYVERLGELGRQALKEMRLLVYELRPAALQEQPLVTALQARLDAVELRAGVQARLLVEAEPDLPPAVQSELFHVAERALNHTLKHAAATAVDVVIGGDAHSLLLEIRHNGQNHLYAPDLVAEANDVWLAMLAKQVHNLGGTFAVETYPDKGTTVRVTLEIGNGENGKSDPHPHL